MKVALDYAQRNDAAKIITVHLRVGEMRDFVEDLTQKYWNYISKGTIAEGAKIRFTVVKTSSICKDCGAITHFDWRVADEIKCSDCGSTNGALFSGQELEIEEIGIETRQTS